MIGRLRRAGVLAVVGEENVFHTVDEAVEALAAG